MTTEAPYQAYFRVWAGWPHGDAEHAKFHQALWAAKGPGVVRQVLELVEKSAAPEADKLAVVTHLYADWQNARVLASMASGSTAFDGGTDFAAALARLRTAAGLSIPDLARKSGLSDDVLRQYETGGRGPKWDAVQKLAAALGVPTDTFRSSPRE